MDQIPSLRYLEGNVVIMSHDPWNDVPRLLIDGYQEISAQTANKLGYPT